MLTNSANSLTLCQLRQAWLCKKKTFSGPKELFLCALTSDKPGLAFRIYKNMYCRMPLVKSAWQAHCKNREYQILKRMPSMTTWVTCRTDRVMTRFLQAKNAKPKPVKGAPGENRAWARLRRPGAEL
jgi:hypothetical protein